MTIRSSWTLRILITLFSTVFAQSQGLPLPYPTESDPGRIAVNKAVALLNSAATCDDLKAVVKQVDYLSNNYPVAMAQSSSFQGPFQRLVSRKTSDLCGTSSSAGSNQALSSEAGSAGIPGLEVELKKRIFENLKAGLVSGIVDTAGSPQRGFRHEYSNLQMDLNGKYIGVKYTYRQSSMSDGKASAELGYDYSGKFDIDRTITWLAGLDVPNHLDRNVKGNLFNDRSIIALDTANFVDEYCVYTNRFNRGFAADGLPDWTPCHNWIYRMTPGNANLQELVSLSKQIKSSPKRSANVSSAKPSEPANQVASFEEAERIQRMKRPLTVSSVASTPPNISNPPESSNDKPIGSVVDSGMLYKSQAGLKVAYSTIYLGKDSCGKKYKVNVTINNGEPTNVNVLASRIEIDSDYDGFESNAGNCNLGDPYYLFGSSPQYENWKILAKGFSATSSHVLYMKSPTGFPHLTANIVPRSDSTSTNVSRSNNGANADSVAQSTGKLVDSGVLYKSESGLLVAYSTVYLGSDTCGKKYRVTISIRNGASSKINVLGSRVDIDSDYDGFEPKAGTCNLGSPYYLFGSSPGFQSWKVLDPGFSDSNSHLIYMKSPSAFPKVSASILAKSQF